MKKIVFIFLIFLCSCNKNEEQKMIEGDIYIKLIDVGSLYGGSEDLIKKVKNILQKDSIKSETKEDLMFDYYKILNKHNLLDKPYFKLKINKESIINVYTNEKEYYKVKALIDSLNRDKEKIEVKLIGQKIEDSIYYTDNIISVEKMKGQTEWRK